MAKGKTSHLLIAGLAGLAAGVAIGLLLAPEKGSKTRKKLRKQFRDIASAVREEFDEELDDWKSVLWDIEPEENEVTDIPESETKKSDQ